MKQLTSLLLSVFALAVASCGSSEQSEQPAQVVANYDLLKLSPVDRTINYQFPATLKGKTEVQVFPQVDGRITAIHYTNGTLVKKGQALVSIDDTQRRLTVQTAKAAVDAAEAALSTAKLQLESQKNLFAKNIVSNYVLQNAENEFKTASANLSQAKAQLAIAQSELDKCTVKAPVDGAVTGQQYKIGALVGPTMADPIAVVSDQSKVEALISVTEQTFASFFTQYGARQTASGLQSADGKSLSDLITFKLKMKDGTIYPIEGKLSSISGMLNASTGTAEARISFDNPNQLLHSGMSVSIISPDEAKGVLVVPQTACKRLQDKYLAYKVDQNGNALGVIIDVVPTDDGKEYIVISGLKAGDEIVANGVTRIVEGQKVK